MLYDNKLSFTDDHSRVVLADKRADYINANYIDVSRWNHGMKVFNQVKQWVYTFVIYLIFQGITEEKMYIATQGK